MDKDKSVGFTVENVNKGLKSEKVLLGEIYSQDGRLGINFTDDAIFEQVNYFLESYLKLEREDYESYFKKL